MTRRDDWISELHYKEFIKPKDFYWEGDSFVNNKRTNISDGWVEV